MPALSFGYSNFDALNSSTVKFNRVSDDMNDYRTVGIYTGYKLKNAPYNGYVVWLNLSQNFDNNFVHQLCFPFATNEIWIRYSAEGVWNAWRRI